MAIPKRKQNKTLNALLLRLRRVERKCDRILAELLIMHRSHEHKRFIVDTTIERLLTTARALRVQCEKESDNVRRMLNTKDDRE